MRNFGDLKEIHVQIIRHNINDFVNETKLDTSIQF